MLTNRRIIGTICPLLALPSVQTEFAWSLANLVNFTNLYTCASDEEVWLTKPKHTFHDLARNQAANIMQGDWLLQLDADHSFSPDLLHRILQVHKDTGYEVISGLYLYRNEPHDPVLWKWDQHNRPAKMTEWPRGEIMEVDCAGAGCLWVHKRVFMRIWQELGEEPFSRLEQERQGGVVGEDFAFFRRLQKLGIRACCPTYVECNHLLTYPLAYETDCPRMKDS